MRNEEEIMKKLFVLLAVILIAVVAFSSCAVKASKVDQKYVLDYADNLTYFKDHKTGLCYSVVAVKYIIGDQEGIGMACVPCEEVEEYLVNP